MENLTHKREESKTASREGTPVPLSRKVTIFALMGFLRPCENEISFLLPDSDERLEAHATNCDIEEESDEERSI